MNVRQLQCFIAVANERHLGRAAKTLHLSQPPLTRQIKLLEEHLGVELFLRKPNGMQITAAGEVLLRDARHIAGLLEAAEQRARLAGQGLIGRLDVGLYGSATFDVVPRILAQFRKNHPEVKLVLHSAPTPDQVVALRQGRVSIVFERLLPGESDMQTEKVTDEKLYVAMPASHALASAKQVQMKQLKNEPMIGQGAVGSLLANLTEQLAREQGFEPNIVQTANDTVTATLMVSCGMGLCVVPASLLNVNMPNLVFRPLQTKASARMPLHCFYMKGDSSPLLLEMLSTVRQFRNIAHHQ